MAVFPVSRWGAGVPRNDGRVDLGFPGNAQDNLEATANRGRPAVEATLRNQGVKVGKEARVEPNGDLL